MDALINIWQDSELYLQRKLVLILAICMVFDIIFGMIASIVYKRMMSNIAATGIARKISSILFVVLLGIIAKELDLVPFFTFTLIALCLAELQSIAELLYILKVPYVDRWIKLVAREGMFEKINRYELKGHDVQPTAKRSHRTKTHESDPTPHDDSPNKTP